MDATPTIAGDPRFIAGKRMRRAGRFEQAVQLLTEVLAVATEGKSEEEQLAPALAPVYYEYGVALMGACREAAAAGEADAEASADGPSAKRRKLDGDADEPGDGGDEADDDDDDDGDGDDGDEDDDAAIAWKLVDQARSIFLAAGDGAAAARCAEQLAGLNVDEARWSDAVVEFSACVDYYESVDDELSLEDETRFLSCVASLGAAYADHAAADGSADVAFEGEGGARVVLVPAADVPDRAASYAAMAEKKTNALLERLARDGAPVDDVRKRDLVALAVEVQVAKDKAAALGGPAAAS